jgi:DNA invertase Pin-like site-specific DNA recombinase
MAVMQEKKVVTVIPTVQKVEFNDGIPVITKRKVCAYCRVSTDSDEQMASYDAQVSEYRKKITENPDWSMVEIYADAGISGTNVKHRTQFNRMISDCYEGKIDLIVTKSISRFARNTVDCLEHVRKMKLIGVEIYFEKENIYSFDSKMELVLTMLSSIAQEESRNISENSKWGIKKRFKDGVAIVNCERFLGYNKDEDGHLIINEEEAKIVSRIYREYLDGKGYTTIARGLTRDRIPTAAGKDKWWDSTVSGILLNEKYMGTLLLQKTVTVDYLTHKRVDNKNMEPQYIVQNNHEPIITPEMWDMVQKERERRFAISAGKNTDRTKYTATYGFSGKLICGQCGNSLKRRHWNSGTPSESIVWQCKSYIDHDGNRCPSKAIKDVELKEAFIRLYSNMVKDKGSFFRNFYTNVEKVIEKKSISTNIDKLTADINTYENDLSELIQLKIRHQIDDIFYNKEYQRIRSDLDELSEKKESLREVSLNQNKMQEKLDYIKKTIGGNTEPLQEFDDELFKTLVEKVLVKDAKHVVFVFEDGLEFKAELEKVKK